MSTDGFESCEPVSDEKTGLIDGKLDENDDDSGTSENQIELTNTESSRSFSNILKVDTDVSDSSMDTGKYLGGFEKKNSADSFGSTSNDTQSVREASVSQISPSTATPTSPSSLMQIFSAFSYGKSNDGLGNIREEDLVNNGKSNSGSVKPTTPVIISHRRQPSGSNRMRHTSTGSISTQLQESLSGSLSRRVSVASVKETQNPRESTPVGNVPDASTTPITHETTEDSFDQGSTGTTKSEFYSDDTYKDTKYRFASDARNNEYYEIFKSIPKTDRLLDEFSCTLSREFLYHGKLYISENHLCFNSNLLGWVSKLVIPIKDIIFIDKTSAAGLFPNAISIETILGKTQFNGFASREETFDLLKEVWARVLIEESENGSKDDKDGNTKDKYFENNESILEKAINSVDDQVPDGDGSAKVYKFDKDCGYVYSGPYFGETMTKTFDKENNEHDLVDISLNVAPGIAFKVLYDDKITKYWKEFSVYSDETFDYSEIPSFNKVDEKGRKYREYEYMKKLNYSIGPSSTKCYAKTTITHLEFEDYIEVINCVSTPEVPSGGSFNTMTRYIFVWDENDRTRSRLKVSFWVDWIGSSWIKGMVESSCQTGLKSSFEKTQVFLVDYLQKVTTLAPTSIEMNINGASERQTENKSDRENLIENQIHELAITCEKLQKRIDLLMIIVSVILILLAVNIYSSFIF